MPFLPTLSASYTLWKSLEVDIMISLRFWQTQGHLAILKPHSRKDAPLPQMLHPGQLSKVPTGQADFGEATWASEWFSQCPSVESDGWTESLKNRQNICAILDFF